VKVFVACNIKHFLKSCSRSISITLEHNEDNDSLNSQFLAEILTLTQTDESSLTDVTALWFFCCQCGLKSSQCCFIDSWPSNCHCTSWIYDMLFMYRTMVLRKSETYLCLLRCQAKTYHNNQSELFTNESCLLLDI
jgi:hypothetical protein